MDGLMDMVRTMVNLVGNCLTSTVKARWEGELTRTPKLVEQEETEITETRLYVPSVVIWKQFQIAAYNRSGLGSLCWLLFINSGIQA